MIQHRQTQLYLCSDMQWCHAAAKAMRFGSASRAVQWVRERKLEENSVQVIWRSPMKNGDWVMWPLKSQPPEPAINSSITTHDATAKWSSGFFFASAVPGREPELRE